MIVTKEHAPQHYHATVPGLWVIAWTEGDADRETVSATSAIEAGAKVLIEGDTIEYLKTYGTDMHEYRVTDTAGHTYSSKLYVEPLRVIR